MKHYSPACFFVSLLLVINSQNGQTQSLSDLNKTIATAYVYDDQKLSAIDSLKSAISDKKNLSPALRFDAYLQLYEAYKLFNHDSAFNYARRLQQIATELEDAQRAVHAKIKLGFILLSSGLFKETLDSLGGLSVKEVPDAVKGEYYSLMGRFYYDLGDFNNNTYTPVYIEKGNRYIDSALFYFPLQSFEHTYFTGLKNLKSNNRPKAHINFLQLLGRPDLSYHEIALTTSTLSDIYIHKGDTDSAIQLLIKATIADIKSSTKETAAILNLAQILYKKGDVKHASIFIAKAVDDAGFYGARQRKLQVSAILPLIEEEKMARIEADKKNLLTYSIIITILLMAVIGLTIVILIQVRKLKTAQAIIMKAHLKEQEINKQLSEANNKLSESNKIKEEYTGYFFSTNSEFFTKIEKFKKALELKLSQRKVEEIIFLVNSINLKKEKEELLKNFDRVFLKLFPNFVDSYNALFEAEDQVLLKDNELLNTDLRIYALIRMGINDSERIAQILEYSVNTINTYKTKIKNKSIIPNEEFDAQIMDIRAV